MVRSIYERVLKMLRLIWTGTNERSSSAVSLNHTLPVCDSYTEGVIQMIIYQKNVIDVIDISYQSVFHNTAY